MTVPARFLRTKAPPKSHLAMGTIAHGTDAGPPKHAGPLPEMEHSADSRYGLGILSLQSATEPSAIAEAIYWIEAAAKQGHADAEALLRKMVQAA